MASHSGVIRANIVNIFESQITSAVLEWQDGVITHIQEIGAENQDLPYLIPGFIDAHVHIESSMLTPTEFGRMALRHGTVAALSDPHEIANVLGLNGVRFMLDNARQTPFNIFFGAPSCVPATPFETAGGALGCQEIEALLQEPEVYYLSEMMNFPGVLNRDPETLEKVDLAISLGYPVDGHAPGLTGDAARRYVQAGISTDHECFTLTEAEDKIAAGMHILIREGSAARNFETLHPLISSHPDKVMLCSDDKHPDDLLEGHINQLVARAVAHGHSVFDVLRCACINPILHYQLPLGRLRVGDAMDAVEVTDLIHFTPRRTWLKGSLTADSGGVLLEPITTAPINNFQAQEITPADLEIQVDSEHIRVIKALDGELITHELLLPPKIVGGMVVPDCERDILLICVLNRYAPQPPAVGFIHNFGLQSGAIASSVAHDSHNIVAVGADITALCQAVNAVVSHQGAIAVATADGVEVLPLPVAGIMSGDTGEEVARQYARLDCMAKELGSKLRAPFMTLSFMALLVIPELKLSDQGLFDGRTFTFTGLG